MALEYDFTFMIDTINSLLNADVFKITLDDLAIAKDLVINYHRTVKAIKDTNNLDKEQTLHFTNCVFKINMLKYLFEEMNKLFGQNKYA